MMGIFKTFFVAACIISVNTTYASTFINGVIQDGNSFIAADPLAITLNKDFKFPRQKYEIRTIFISNLSYNDSFKDNERKIDLSQIQSIYATGGINLMEFNPNTNMYKFSLSISPYALESKKNISAASGHILFAKDQHNCIMRGYSTKKDGVPYIENKPEIQNDCQLDAKLIKSEASEYISLTPRHNIPVIIEINS